MSEALTLEEVDREGAIAEALDNVGVDPQSRTAFLRKIVLGGGTVAAAAAFPKVALAAPSPRQDIQVLNFALTLEFLEAEFYTLAERGNGLSGQLRTFARVVGAHERAHVAFLRRALGARAVDKPEFDFGDIPRNPARFSVTAQVLEDTGVAAYNGQVRNVTKKTLAAAASIVSVEARHAAWIRDINRQNPAPKALDDAKSRAQILAAVNATGFIKG